MGFQPPIFEVIPLTTSPSGVPRGHGPRWSRPCANARAWKRAVSPPPVPRALRANQSRPPRAGAPERGYDGGKNIKGRKRHLWVDTWGWLIAVLITSAGLDDGVAAPILLGHVQAYDVPRLVTIFADAKYHNHALEAWLVAHRAGWHLEVKTRPEGTKG